MSKLGSLGIKNYSDDNTLYIPNFENRNNSYNINSIYTPRTFSDTNEYVTHLENLRKLKNYININKHLELLNKSVYKNIVRAKLLKINWHNKIRESISEEKKHLKKKISNIRRSNSVLEKSRNTDKLEKIKPRCKSSLNKKTKRFKGNINYKNLKKVNIKTTDIDDFRKDFKLDDIKLPKI